MKPSKYQQAINMAVITTPNNIAVQAGPGSGKTTSIIEASKLIPYGKSAVFIAFNKSIVEELKSKLPPTVDCSTMHSLGLKSIYKHYPGEKKIKGEGKQLEYIIPLVEHKNNRERWLAIYTIDRLLSLARATMAEMSREGMIKVIENYALDISEEQVEIGIRALTNLYRFNDDQDRYNITVDFQDMIEMPVRNKKIGMPQYDYVFIDEIQDLSALDHLFVKRLRKPIGGRIISVGDPHQSIYGFRGSDPRSFDKFASEPNTTILPLSISYRCAKGIVTEAQKIYGDIEPYVENQQGIVRTGKVEEIREGDLVLCRNTRPLIDVFFQLIEVDKKAYVMGSEMEKGLKSLLSVCESSDNSEIAHGKIQKTYDKLLSELKARGISKPENHPRAVTLFEKIDILNMLFRRFSTVFEVEQFIERVFDDKDRKGVKLTTIHKAKGTECERVFLIDTYEGKKLIPSPYAVTKDQLIQEKNLQFVAVTRAKHELVYLNL